MFGCSVMLDQGKRRRSSGLVRIGGPLVQLLSCRDATPVVLPFWIISLAWIDCEIRSDGRVIHE
ncbi:MAG TPA: hypothetical protein VG273_07375 [Bryobacteraceae bacterium]|nr:hypothetical protein [Bryobacteraceae bacterium]